MSDSTSVSFSIINMDGIGEVGVAFIEKISGAIGMIREPRQLKLLAKAEVAANVIRAEGEIKVLEIEERAIRRWVTEQTERQQIIEQITANAIPLLSENSNPQSMQKDWIVNFFNQAKLVSDKEVQMLWSRVLAGEADSPGSFSKRTVRVLAELDKEDGEHFTNVCRFVVKLEILTPLIFNETEDLYAKAGLTFNSLSHLDSIGLIDFEGFGYYRHPKEDPLVVEYFGDTFQLQTSSIGVPGLSYGRAKLTEVGHQLATICQASPVDGFMDYVRHQWKEYLLEDDPGTS